MERILIVSDNHGDETGLKKIIENEGPFDRMIHLGDSQMSEKELFDLVPCPIDIVSGNCDSYSSFPKEKILYIGNHTIYITHGHLKGVNYGMERLINTAIEAGADIALYGHTHTPFRKDMPGLTVINPGSISRPRQFPKVPTWVLMEVDDYGDAVFSFQKI